jgi:roadblock/LC7 domain-containing protein
MVAPGLTALRTQLGRALSRRVVLGYGAGSALAAAVTAVANQAASAWPVNGRRQIDLQREPWASRGGDPAFPTRAFAVEELAAMRGVAMAIAWDRDGALTDFATAHDLPRALAVDAARYGAALSALAPGLAGAYAEATGFGWAPFRTIIASGGEWTAVVGSDHRGVWAKTADADLNQLAKALDAARH